MEISSLPRSAPGQVLLPAPKGMKDPALKQWFCADNSYTIPKGWSVLVWTRAVHMDPESHSNPEEFRPARWDEQIPKVGSYHPFSAGNMICPGADLAKLEISIFLHYFLLNYK
ncbi:hypothetical protein DITRI_Ditri04bG0094200 [Diplodiscus trichospermus]